MNRVLKRGFVKRTQNLHKFSRQNNPVTKTNHGYEKYMAIKYKRAVYSEMRDRMRKSTLFHAKRTPEENKYLVYYHKKGNHEKRVFACSNREFPVVADPDQKIYECECKLWTHTGEHSRLPEG
ncbi:hypothetical protein D1007_42153 [Hordeum vulgare]|nr:hypothetical protein D1007_42153 [Hordeum vulgare]